MITIGRHWHQPQIHVKFDENGVYIELDKEDVIKALVTEIGNPTFKFSKTSIENAIRNCFLKIQESSLIKT